MTNIALLLLSGEMNHPMDRITNLCFLNVRVRLLVAFIWFLFRFGHFTV